MLHNCSVVKAGHESEHEPIIVVFGHSVRGVAKISHGAKMLSMQLILNTTSYCFIRWRICHLTGITVFNPQTRHIVLKARELLKDCTCVD